MFSRAFCRLEHLIDSNFLSLSFFLQSKPDKKLGKRNHSKNAKNLEELQDIRNICEPYHEFVCFLEFFYQLLVVMKRVDSIFYCVFIFIGIYGGRDKHRTGL